MARQESGCGKYQPIQSKEQGILRELPFALHGRLKAPENEPRVSGAERKERQIRPAIADHKHSGRYRQRHVGGKSKPDIGFRWRMNQGHIRGIVRSGHGEHGHHL